jgi:hypothetical protein
MLRWCDGFEHYGAIAHMTEGVGGGAAWSQVDPVTSAHGWALSTANPATGDYHMRLTDATGGARIMRRVFGVAKQVVGFGYRFSVEDLPSAEGIGSTNALVLAGFRDVSNVTHCSIVMGTDGSVFAVRGGFSGGGGSFGGTLLGRSDPCIAPGGYHHLEVKAKIDNSTGYIEVRVNQVTVLNLTGIDTQNTANAAAAQVVVGTSGNDFSTGTAAFGTFDLDDAFTWDNDASDAENTVVDFIGDKGCYWLPPNADTATADFTKTGSATSYGAIDEVPPSGTEYLSDATGTARTIVGVASLPANIAEVIAMVPVAYVRKEESGAVTMRLGVVSSGDESYGPNDDPSTGYAYLRPAPKTIDPNTGVPWANTAEPELLIERTA